MEKSDKLTNEKRQKDEPLGAEAPSRTVAAIDVGANSLRMVIAEVLPDGHIEVIERLQRAVRLGQDTFRRAASVHRACAGHLRAPRLPADARPL